MSETNEEATKAVPMDPNEQQQLDDDGFALSDGENLDVTTIDVNRGLGDHTDASTGGRLPATDPKEATK